jgi:lysophospholipase L1-like esterase
MSRRFLAPALVALLAACGGASAGGDSFLEGIGRIPGAQSVGADVQVDGADLTAPGVQGQVLGASATGNRLIVIGDSILAGTAARYGNEMCNTLVPMGWNTVVEAEAGQPASFGRDVLKARIYDGWDAAVVFLGTNPSANIDRYRQDMTRIIESLAPRPTLLLTTTLFRESQKAVNDVIREITASHSNVSLLDWGTASMQPGVLNKDNVHPTTAGRTLLVRAIAAAVGNAPTSPGKCLPAQFTDDSRVTGGVMPSTSVAGATQTSVAGAASTTIPPPVASTTTLPASTTTAPRAVTTTVAQAAATTTTRP